MSGFREDAARSYHQQESDYQRRMIEEAEDQFRLTFGDYDAAYTFEKDYWGEYVLIEPTMYKRIFLRYKGGTFRLGKLKFWSLEGRQWSRPVESMEDIGYQMKHFRVGLHKDSASGIIGEYP